jgi:hypothetical protein
MGKWGDLGRLYYSRAVTLCERLPAGGLLTSADLLMCCLFSRQRVVVVLCGNAGFPHSSSAGDWKMVRIRAMF